MGYRPFVKKQNPVVFRVKNIAPDNKRIKLFHTPIANGMELDLLNIPNVSEDVIRHSLLKGSLYLKIIAKEIIVVESNIELFQFDPVHREFLREAGITVGIDPAEDMPLPTPTRVGQILYSVYPDRFSVVVPITSEAGWLVNDDGTLLVSEE